MVSGVLQRRNREIISESGVVSAKKSRADRQASDRVVTCAIVGNSDFASCMDNELKSTENERDRALANIKKSAGKAIRKYRTVGTAAPKIVRDEINRAIKREVIGESATKADVMPQSVNIPLADGEIARQRFV